MLSKKNEADTNTKYFTAHETKFRKIVLRAKTMEIND